MNFQADVFQLLLLFYLLIKLLNLLRQNLFRVIIFFSCFQLIHHGIFFYLELAFFVIIRLEVYLLYYLICLKELKLELLNLLLRLVFTLSFRFYYLSKVHPKRQLIFLEIVSFLASFKFLSSFSFLLIFIDFLHLKYHLAFQNQLLTNQIFFLLTFHRFFFV